MHQNGLLVGQAPIDHIAHGFEDREKIYCLVILLVDMDVGDSVLPICFTCGERQVIFLDCQDEGDFIATELFRVLCSFQTAVLVSMLFAIWKGMGGRTRRDIALEGSHALVLGYSEVGLD